MFSCNLDKITLALIAAGIMTPAALAADGSWKIDSAHSSAGFSIKHMMISNVKGSFDKVEGTVEYDGKNLRTLAVDSSIDVSTVSTGDKGRDGHLLGKDFFDAEKYGKMTFKSKTVKAAGKGKCTIVGDLTIKGKTKEVTLNVDGPSEIIKDAKGVQHVGASATTTINRKDFGISYGGLMDNGGAMIGDTVAITLEVEATKEAAK